jgi:hypothetical protein
MALMSVALCLEDHAHLALGNRALAPDVSIMFVLLFGFHCKLGARITLVTMLAVLRSALSGEPVGRDLFLLLLAAETLALLRGLVFVGNFATLLIAGVGVALWLVLGRALFRWIFDHEQVGLLRMAAAALLAALIAPWFVRLVVRTRVFGRLIEGWS